jgi:hypothetical protein
MPGAAVPGLHDRARVAAAWTHETGSNDRRLVVQFRRRQQLIAVIECRHELIERIARLFDGRAGISVSHGTQ